MEREFNLYCLWRFLPSILLGKPAKYLDSFGITDDGYKEIIGIKTQKEFAMKFGIRDQGTLTDWNERIEKTDCLKKLENKWIRGSLSNVIFAVYREQLRKGDVRRAKFLFKLAGHDIDKPRRDDKTQLEETTRLLRKIAKGRSKYKKPKEKYMEKPVFDLSPYIALVEESLEKFR